MIFKNKKFYDIADYFTVLDDFGKNPPEVARYVFSCVLFDEEINKFNKFLLVLKSNNIDVFISDNTIVFVFGVNWDKTLRWCEYPIYDSMINIILPELRKKIDRYDLLK